MSVEKIWYLLKVTWLLFLEWCVFYLHLVLLSSFTYLLFVSFHFNHFLFSINNKTLPFLDFSHWSIVFSGSLRNARILSYYLVCPRLLYSSVKKVFSYFLKCVYVLRNCQIYLADSTCFTYFSEQNLAYFESAK